MSVSNEFKNITKKIKQQNIKLSICDGELTVKEIHMMPVHIFNALPVWKLRKQKETIAKELKYSFDGQLFKTIMKQVEITVKNANEIKDKDINFQYGLFINNKFEYIDLGNYFIKDIEDSKKKDEITVTGYDRMIRFMKTFKQSELQLTYPCKMLKLVQKMCEVCGVELYSTDFYNADLDVEEDFFTAQELTYRDVLEKIAQATLTTAFIEDNKLNLYKVSNDAIEKIDKSYLTDLTIKEKFGPANVLVLGRGDVEDNIEEPDEKSIEQNGRCEIRFDENEFIEFQREKVIKGMFEQIKGLEYYSFEASDVGVMWLKPCACIELGDKEDSLYKSYYLKANITINTGISSDIEAELPEEANTEYKVTTKEEKKTLKVERLAKKNEGLIQDIIEQNTETSNKLSKHEHTINGITDTVKSVETKVETVEDKADNAVATADSASIIANNAQTTATTANTTANEAKSTADTTKNNLSNNYYTKTQTESQINQKADSITSSVSKEIAKSKEEAIFDSNADTDEKLKEYTETEKLGTFIEQNYEYIKYAWNQISQYLKMEGLEGKASLNIYNENNNLLMNLNENGETFYDELGNELGSIGVIKSEESDVLAFSMPVDWENVDTSRSMAWGIVDPNGKFLPIFYLAGYYGAENSEYGGELIVEGKLSAGELHIINNLNFEATAGLNWSENKYIMPAIVFSSGSVNEWLTYKAPYGHEFFVGDTSIFSMNEENIYMKKPFFIPYASDGTGHEGYPMIGTNLDYKYYCTTADGVNLGFFINDTFVDAISDERLKKDIKEIDDKFLDAINEIGIKQFKADNRNGLISFGIIAQELISVFEKYEINPDDYEILQKIKYKLEDSTEYYRIQYEQFFVLKQLASDRKIKELERKDKQKDELIQSLIKRIETLEEGVDK